MRKIDMDLLGEHNLVPNEAILAMLYSDPQIVGLSSKDLEGKESKQIQELLIGEYITLVAKQAAQLGSQMLFNAQWGYKAPDWFDHRHHFLSPEKHCTDFWTLSANNVISVLPIGGKMLNLCSGDGFYDYHFFSKRAGEILCVDINEEAHRLATRCHAAPNVQYLLANVLTFQPRENYYDVVCIRGAIEHFNEENQRIIYEKALYALKPGGFFCGDTVANNHKEDGKVLWAHECEWSDELEMQKSLRRVFSDVQTQTLHSVDRITLVWKCRKPMPGEARAAVPATHQNTPHKPVAKIIPQRAKAKATTSDPSAVVGEAQTFLNSGNYFAAVDLLEALHARHPEHAIQLLNKIYEIYQNVPDRESRYWLYQARHYDFNIKAGEKVLDIGSGNNPFPLATHLADISLADNRYGRAGEPFKYIGEKPVYECDIENMPFKDGEFDFVYCSHVLEHVRNPEKACAELQRIAKRGFIETPIRGKDLFLDTGAVSNHLWKVDLFNGKLIFTEYEPEELLGFQCGVLLDMHVNPQTDRERAFSALLLLKSAHVNTMLMWQDAIDVEVRRLAK